MPIRHASFAGILPRRGVSAWTGWLGRWMLVLLLVADHVGAPLHHHQHDSGVDASWTTISTAHEQDLDTHVEDGDHDQHFAHATLALRSSGEVVKTWAADESTQPLVLAPAFLALLVPEEEAGQLRPPPAWRSPPIRSHRSLPPAGRAPPLLA